MTFIRCYSYLFLLCSTTHANLFFFIRQELRQLDVQRRTRGRERERGREKGTSNAASYFNFIFSRWLVFCLPTIFMINAGHTKRITIFPLNRHESNNIHIHRIEYKAFHIHRAGMKRRRFSVDQLTYKRKIIDPFIFKMNY